VLVLEPDAKPLELQSCHPAGQSRFVLHARHAFPAKIFDYHLSPNVQSVQLCLCFAYTGSLFAVQSNYKSLLVSQKTSCADVVKNVLRCHKIDERDAHRFAIVLVELGEESVLQVYLYIMLLNKLISISSVWFLFYLKVFHVHF